MSPLMAPRADSSFFRKRQSFSSCWGAKRDRGGFLPPHHPGKRLGPDGAVSAPKGSLRSGSFFFARLLQPFCLYQEVLGVVAANIKFLAFVSKIHHPKGSVSAFSDASVFRILSSVHGVWQSFPILGSLLGSLHGSAVLQAGHGSGSEFFSTVLDSASAFSARLAHSGLLPSVDFLSPRTFLWLCNSLGIVVDWEMSQLVAHQ